MSYSIRNLRILTTVTALAFTSFSGGAAIILTGNPGQAGGTLQSDAELTFTLTSSGDIYAIIFDNWVSADDGRLNERFGTGSITYRIDGGSPATVSGTVGLIDNVVRAIGSVSPRSGALAFDGGSIPASAGQTITFSPFTLSLTSDSNFNPLALGSFTGNVFLIDTGNDRITPSIAAVPEPEEEAACAALGLMGFGLWCWKASRSRKG